VPFRTVESLRPIRNKPWLGFSVGLLIFGAGFLLRYAAGGTLETVPFITLFPAILIAALIGGVWVGLFVAVLSFVAGWYFFIPIFNSFTLSEPTTALALLMFWVTASIQLYVIEALNRAVDRLSEERDRVHVLFQELQHRVANNMTFVASLLRLQRKALEANPANGISIIEQAEGRLQTMARIHRRLYDPNIVNLPLTTYLEALAKDILNASGANNIVCVVEVAPVKLELHRLVTLSLLINELLTNSLKHGFSGRDAGIISVKIEKESESQLVLSIRDDGRGFTGDKPTEGSLGMMIIRSLATQLGGEMTWSGVSGTTARLAFPA
jgi:two-component system, sensor histidine kinase PdtaS